MASQISAIKETIRDTAGNQSWTIDDIRDRQNRSLHSAISDGFDRQNYVRDNIPPSVPVSLDELMKHQFTAIHNSLSDGFESQNYETDLPTAQQVTLDEVILHQNRAHNALADGFEGSDYLTDMPEGKLVTIDEVMLHQNRVLHNEDGFEPEDYRK